MSMQLKIGFFLVLCGIVGLEGFSYEDPDKEWGEEYPTCNGDQQSPVNLEFDLWNAGPMEDEKLQWSNYENIPDSMKIVNNGHTIQINPVWSSDSDRPYLSGGPLDGEYVIEQFHFHWGQNDTVGTEHAIDGQTLAMELHMVHWKREYGSLAEAVNKPDGLAVVGAFYETAYAEDGSDDAIEKIWGELGNLQRENDESELEPFPLSAFDVMNHDQHYYVSYHGSLTTPGCNEVVTWLLAVNSFPATSDDMKKIRAIELDHGDDHNNRPMQPLNGRELTFYLAD